MNARIRAYLLALLIGLILGAGWGFYRWTKITEIYVLTTIPDLILLSPESQDLIEKITGYELKVEFLSDPEKLKTRLHAVNLLPDLIISDHTVLGDKFIANEMMKLPEDIMELVHKDLQFNHMNYFLSLFWDIPGKISEKVLSTSQKATLPECLTGSGNQLSYYSDWVSNKDKFPDLVFNNSSAKDIRVIGLSVTQSPDRTHVWRWLRQILKSNYIQVIADKERRGFALLDSENIRHPEFEAKNLRQLSLVGK